MTGDLLTTEALGALLALTAMEIVLGIDNLVFIAILTGKLPPPQQPLARRAGLTLARFIERHPSVKILALSFLLLIGVMLVAEGMGTHVEKAYIYVAMAFSLFVELLNLRYRTTRRPVRLHGRFEEQRGST
jgi:predicted tellurium resistance membrane protein TerC